MKALHCRLRILFDLYENAQFEVVVANIQAINGENPSWIKPYTILTQSMGQKLQ